MYSTLKLRLSITINIQLNSYWEYPSSSARLCWGRLKSWWHTRTEATPQISTSCTGRTACSLACISSAAWRWWQSQCKPSVWWIEKKQKHSPCESSLLQKPQIFHHSRGKCWKIKFKNMKDSWQAARGFSKPFAILKDKTNNWSSLITSQYFIDKNSMIWTKSLWSND